MQGFGEKFVAGHPVFTNPEMKVLSRTLDFPSGRQVSWYTNGSG